MDKFILAVKDKIMPMYHLLVALTCFEKSKTEKMGLTCKQE